MNEREREVEPPLHASRVAGDLAVGRVGEPDAVEQLLRSGLALVLPHALERGLQAQVVASGQKRVERRLLQGDADQAAHLRPVLDDVVAADASGPRSRGQQRRQHMDGRGLAGAVRAEEAVDLTWRDGDVDPVHRARAFLELANETLDLDPVLALHRPTLPPACRGQAGLRGSFDATTGLPPRW